MKNDYITQIYRNYVARPICSYCRYRPADFFRYPVTQDEFAIPLYACRPCIRKLRLASGVNIIWEPLKPEEPLKPGKPAALKT